MSCSDVKSAKVTATGVVVGHRARVKAISFKPAAAGAIVLRDGAGGTILFDIDVDTGSDTYIDLPENGILFTTSVHATLTVVSSLTVIYA